MRKTHIILGSIAAAMLVTPGAVLADTSQQSTNAPEVDPGLIGDPPNAAEMRDLRTIAAQEGISVTTAVQHYGWHDDFSRMVQELRSKHHGTFAGARITGPSSAWVAFAGSVPATARETVESFSLAVEPWATVSVEPQEDRGFTEARLDSTLVSVHDALRHVAGVQDIVSGYDLAARPFARAPRVSWSGAAARREL